MRFERSELESIDWSLKVRNPEAFGEAEKEQWLVVEPVLTEVLDELWAADKIETVFEPRQKAALISCIQKVDDFSLVHNTLMRLTDSRDKASRFTNAIAKFGFDESKIVLDYVLVAFSLAVLKIELFKLVLLFHLKDADPSVGRFSGTMAEAAPKSWRKLKPLVDSPLRNSLAHCTYAMLPPKIVLYRNAKMEILEEMNLSKFMMKAKSQDVLLQCLLDLLKKRGLYALDRV